MGLSKSSSSSTNQAYGGLQSQLGGVVPYAAQGGQGISALLSGDASGFNKFKSATGFTQELSRGLRDLTGVSAARGLLRSGSAGKAFMSYGQELENKTAKDYLSSLLGLGGLGIQAGGVLSDAGKQSKSSSKGLQLPTPSFGG